MNTCIVIKIWLEFVPGMQFDICLDNGLSSFWQKVFIWTSVDIDHPQIYASSSLNDLNNLIIFVKM